MRCGNAVSVSAITQAVNEQALREARAGAPIAVRDALGLLHSRLRPGEVRAHDATLSLHMTEIQWLN